MTTNPDQIAESVAHKITVSARGGYDGTYVKCLCGWAFASRHDTRVDRKVEKHLRLNDGGRVTPYYDDGQSTIYHGRMEDILPGLQADAIITDAPYGISDGTQPFNGGKPRPTTKHPNNTGVNTWHPPSDWDHAIDPEWCRLVSKAAPVVAWFGHWRKRAEVEAAMTHQLRAEIVWAKDTHVGPPCPLAMRDERIWLFSDRGIKGRTFQTSVWDVPVIPSWEPKHHRNQKPVSLMRRLVEFLTDPGALILDPFMGSGTTLRAAKDCGRRGIGIEIDERYCEVSAKRLGQEVLWAS